MREGGKNKKHTVSSATPRMEAINLSEEREREERNQEETGRNVQTVATSSRVKINQLNEIINNQTHRI